METDSIEDDTIQGGRPDYANQAVFRRNTLPPRSYWIPETALSLNGTWSFHHADSPLQAPAIRDCDPAAWGTIPVPAHWQLHGHGRPQYTNIAFPFPAQPPHVPDENPTGTYARRFAVPAGWPADAQLRLRFDGVDSAYHVWLNGRFVGYSQGSRNASEFDVSEVARRDGENELLVRVYQWSDGSYIEDQDQWWLSGIFRDVHLIAFSASCRIEDFFIRGDLDSAYHHGVLQVEADVHCPLGGTICVTLRERGERDTKIVCQEVKDVLPNSTKAKFSIHVQDPAKWTAETPHLYQVEIVLASGTESTTVNHDTGFRKVELKDGLIKVNGKAIRFRGVNRHDHHPQFGRAVPIDFIRRDLLLMKEHNINALRCAHYPSHPALYALANEIGLWLIDEADLECHGFAEVVADNTAEWDGTETAYQALVTTISDAARTYLSDNPSWTAAYLDRLTQLVHRDKNHPSVVVWSLGNESFAGRNLVAMYRACRRLDPSRPVHYEGDTGTGTTTDMHSYMYPELDALERRARTVGVAEDGTAARPIVLCEYAHAMGNGPGRLHDYEEVFRRCPRVQGGFVWEWANHGLQTEDRAGRRFYAYGGDFGETLHDGTFVMDGLCSSAHEPMPGLQELKHAYAPVAFELVSRSLRIENRHDFADLGGFVLTVELQELGRSARTLFTSSSALPAAAAGTETSVELDDAIFNQASDAELLLTASLALSASTNSLSAGHEIAFFQHSIAPASSLTLRPSPAPSSSRPEIHHTRDTLTITTAKSVLEFSRVRGLLRSWTSTAGSPLLAEPAPHRGAVLPGFWRAPTDNDIRVALPHWRALGVDRLTSQLRDGPHIVDEATAGSGGVLTLTTRTFIGPASLGWGWPATTVYQIPRDGSALSVFVALDAPVGTAPTSLPRVGLDIAVAPPAMDGGVRWCGRGPGESYPDKRHAQRVGVWAVDGVARLQTAYEVPQENGNRTETRWVELGAADGRTALRATRIGDAFPLGRDGEAPAAAAAGQEGDAGRGLFNFTATRHAAETLEKAAHPHELVEEEAVLLRLDAEVSGVGTAACGPGPQGDDLVVPGEAKYGFLLELV